MTFREFSVQMMKNETLQRILPLEFRKTFPYFTLEDGVLCAAFACFRVKIEDKRPLAFAPGYYLKITYPGCRLLSFEKLANRSEKNAATPMTPRTKEEIQSLFSLCDAVLKAADEDREALSAAIEAYNAALTSILEADQLETIRRYIGA